MKLAHLKSALLLVLTFVGTNVFSQSTPKYSNEFLSIGVGARAFGMSNSVVASTDDVTSGFWNPAGLVGQKDKLQVSFMHSNYFNGLANYDYLALSTKVKDNAALSFSMVRFGVDGIPNTLDLIRNGQINYDRVTEFSAVDYGFFVSYAQKAITDGLSFGGSAKIVHRRAGEFTTAWGFGIDVSAKYETDNNWKFAAVARDVTTTFNAWNFNFTEAEEQVFRQTGNEVPINSLELTLPKFILGAAKKIDFNDDFDLLAEANLDLNTDGKRNTLLRTNFISGDPHLGLEAGYKKIIYLRAGVGNFQQVKDLTSSYEQQWTFMPNIGLGLKLNQISIDYALSDIGDQSAAQYSHVFSIRASVNPPK
jgi:hypothetical protein